MVTTDGTPDSWSGKLQLIQSLPPDVGVVFCRSRLVLENGTLVFLQWQRAGRYDFDDFLVNSNPARNGSSLLIRKSCFADAGGFDEDLRYIEDLDMWLRIAENSKTPVLWASKYFLVDMRLRPGSITRDRAGLESALSDMLEAQTAQASPVACWARLRSACPDCVQVWRKRKAGRVLGRAGQVGQQRPTRPDCAGSTVAFLG